jgi:hypothetical protein
MLIEQESYFVVHAPRQTAKITASGRYAAVMCHKSSKGRDATNFNLPCNIYLSVAHPTVINVPVTYYVSPVELKVWRDKKPDPQAEGIEQLESYLARLGLDFGWLFVFDRRKNAPPIEERLSTQIVMTNIGA